MDVPKAERRSIVERLLFLVGDVDPGGSTIETRFFEPCLGLSFSLAALGESPVFRFMRADGLGFDRRLDGAVIADVGFFAMLLVLLREGTLMLWVSRAPVGVDSRWAALGAGFRLGGIPFLGEERIFFNESLALLEP